MENKSGKKLPYLAVLSGFLLSMAANGLHAVTKPPTATGDWHVTPWVVGLSLLWPALLFVTLEVILKAPWPAGWYWFIPRFLLLGGITFVVAVISYWHMHDLLMWVPTSRFEYTYGPLVFDGLLGVGTLALFGMQVTNTTERNQSDAESSEAVSPSETVDHDSAVPVLLVVDSRADDDPEPAETVVVPRVTPQKTAGRRKAPRARATRTDAEVVKAIQALGEPLPTTAAAVKEVGKRLTPPEPIGTTRASRLRDLLHAQRGVPTEPRVTPQRVPTDGGTSMGSVDHVSRLQVDTNVVNVPTT